MALQFQQRGSALVRRVLLVAFLIVSLALLTTYAREGETGPLHGVQSAVSGAFAPLSRAGAAVGSGAASVGEGVEDLTANDDTLSGLRDANAELVEQLAQAEEYRQEAQRLQGLLDMKDAYDIEGRCV